MRIVLGEERSGAPLGFSATSQSTIHVPRSAIHGLEELQTERCYERVCEMKVFKKAVVAMVVMLACVGVYSALRNLPVVSGCGFYGECPETAESHDVPAASLAVLPTGATPQTRAP